MAARVVTVAFQGVEARRVDVQVQFTSGEPKFFLVGMGDKAISESRERVRAAFSGLGLSLPSRRIIANLAPADLPKEGSHYDLPIALAIMAGMNVIPPDVLDDWAAVGELSLDGRITAVAGALPAAVAAGAMGLGLICPEACGPEAAWAGETRILAAPSLIALVNHFRGTQILSPPGVGTIREPERVPDLREVKGQENAKRALEIAAAGGHNLAFVGPPGSGKSMMAARLPGLLPPLTPEELLETSMIHSVAGLIAKGELTRARPFRSPHHSASMAALTGGGLKAKPGEVSLAHNGVLFLDELPEFSAQALDSLRGPLETGEVVVARANAHVRYPARVQLVAAMNPCRCGHGGPGRGFCGRAPRCQTDYLGRISGPLMDRIDLQVEVPPVTAADLALPAPAEGTAEAAARVAQARAAQAERAAAGGDGAAILNSRADGDWLETIAALDAPAKALLTRAAEAGGLTARGWTRTVRLARTIADLDGSDAVRRVHVAEALIYRRVAPGGPPDPPPMPRFQRESLWGGGMANRQDAPAQRESGEPSEPVNTLDLGHEWNGQANPPPVREMDRLPHAIPYQGSKRSLAPLIAPHIPQEIDCWFEPFAGSAAMTIWAASEGIATRYILGDVLVPITELWRAIIDAPGPTSARYREIWEGQLASGPDYFNTVRARYNASRDPVDLLYLICRCVKNAVRFNKAGNFTQSHDKRRLGMQPQRMDSAIKEISRLLRGRTEVRAGDWLSTTADAGPSDFIYMDPPYLGTTIGPDKRYAEQLELERLTAGLSDLLGRGIRFALSYDGMTGEKVYGAPLPESLGLTRLLLHAGKSSQATLSGRSEDTVESLYLSPGLAQEIDGVIRLKPAQSLFTFARAS